MNCDKVRNELKAYLDNELNFISKWMIARHIKYCSDCKLEMKAMESISNEIKETKVSEAPKGLQAKVLSKIKFDTSQPKSVRTKRTLIYSLSAVAAFVVIAAAVFPTFHMAREYSHQSLSPGSPGMSGPPAGGMGGPHDSAPLMEKAPGAPAGINPERSAVKAKLAKRLPDSVYKHKVDMSLPVIEPMIIKNADISIRVKDFDTAFNKIVFICKSNRGYIVSTNSSLNGEVKSYGQISFRVPNYLFEQAIRKLSELGKVTSNNISGDDVSGEVVDLESSLRNKRAEEKQYLIIMERAKRISDVITVTNELTRVRGEIDQIQGRLKYLKDSVAMSTINVELFEKAKQSKSDDNGLGKVFKDAVGSFVDSVERLGSIFIWILVFSPFWAIPIIVWLVIRHRNKKTE